VENGFVGLPDLPGVGFEGKAELYSVMKSVLE
jgi:L-alanine-DL-glutamate epimerase-like enolase superfamily enzyme